MNKFNLKRTESTNICFHFIIFRLEYLKVLSSHLMDATNWRVIADKLYTLKDGNNIKKLKGENQSGEIGNF